MSCTVAATCEDDESLIKSERIRYYARWVRYPKEPLTANKLGIGRLLTVFLAPDTTFFCP